MSDTPVGSFVFLENLLNNRVVNVSDLKSKKTSKIPDLVERPKRIQGQPRLWAKKVPSMSRELDLEFHAQKPGAPTKVVHRSKMTPATKLFVSVMCVTSC